MSNLIDAVSNYIHEQSDENSKRYAQLAKQVKKIGFTSEIKDFKDNGTYIEVIIKVPDIVSAKLFQLTKLENFEGVSSDTKKGFIKLLFAK